MQGFRKFSIGWLCSADIHFPEKLPGICGNNNGVVLFRQPDCKGRFTGCGRTKNSDKGFAMYDFRCKI